MPAQRPGPGRPGELPSGDDVRRGDARRQDGRHPWLADELLLRDLIEARVPLLGPASARSSSPRRPARRPNRRPSRRLAGSTSSSPPEGVSDPLLAPLAPGFTAFQWHSYRSPAAPDAVALARSPAALQAFRAGERTWGIQFHAEVTRARRDRLDRARGGREGREVGLDPEAMITAIRADWSLERGRPRDLREVSRSR